MNCMYTCRYDYVVLQKCRQKHIITNEPMLVKYKEKEQQHSKAYTEAHGVSITSCYSVSRCFSALNYPKPPVIQCLKCPIMKQSQETNEPFLSCPSSSLINKIIDHVCLCERLHDQTARTVC